MTSDYIEQAGSLKLVFTEGEIDFIASAPLTRNPAVIEEIFGREIQVETSAEIIAKKLWHRGREFTARDIFDLAMVIEKESGALNEIMPVLRERREVVQQRIASQQAALRESFHELEVLEYKRSFDECLRLINKKFEE
jgi:predicted nucleotidyltransferase component of viral defense system